MTSLFMLADDTRSRRIPLYRIGPGQECPDSLIAIPGEVALADHA